MNRFCIILIAAVVGLNASAQPRFVPENPKQKVGEMLFQNPKDVNFPFKNKGNRPLIITEVHPSCGCVKVTYPKVPIKAGDSGVITATYDAAMLGTFQRELMVYCNAQEEPIYLAFQGRVVEKPLDYEGDFPIDLGNIRLSSNYVEFDDVNKGDKPVVELQVANVEHADYKPQLMHLPNYLNAEYIPEVIQEGRVGRIRLTLNSDNLFIDGLNQTSVYLARYMGDKVSEKNEIVVSSVLLPAFSNLTASQMQHAPYIVLMDGDEMINGQTTIVLGEKKKMTKVVNVTNIGEETLNISAVQLFNRALTVSLSDRNILPHGTAKLKITVDRKALEKAKNEPRLLIISNDPRHAKTVLDINVE